jgi:subtilisin family serine protease
LSTSRLTHIAQQAIKHAVKTWDVHIISMSFGLMRPVPRTDGNEAEENSALERYRHLVGSIETAIREASLESPRIMFAAASNNGKNDKRTFPASYDRRVIGICASDGMGGDGGINPPKEGNANFMTLGMGLELMERQWVRGAKTLTPTYKKVYRSGTSFATPIAAGIAATVLHLAARVNAINDRTREKLTRPEEMEKMLELMSIPNVPGAYRYLAPWNHWRTNWQGDRMLAQMIWNEINIRFDA